uniref:RNA polymerase alpha subunit n=1 Tax=Pelargonium myrrhifolium TaxID=253081 RepID=A0A0G2T3S0_9ROSI|nr:RNA polymerase alpha subunit [Pelargonium myrrhifolium]YP_009299669.1 RNA polymerase alpha subunit [Pelargonium myrrhifolium]AJB99540.1 RNA polymerase alpha subunit [Pelargonium myrrhifolium]AJB99584.1 RNA polymerase alpha subunit [Pelargonium myrrhifolium]AKF43082.1 RNA polymerase alpha subunit [Pelargonium myrrhifolium]
MEKLKLLKSVQIKNSRHYGKFRLSRLKNGQGKLISLVLRQALLTGLVCACFTSAKIKNENRFCIVGVEESIPEIFMNLQGINLKGQFDDLQIPYTTHAIIDLEGPLKVTARDIKFPIDLGLSVVDETRHIANITQPIPFVVKLRIEINSGNSKPETGVPNEEGEEGEEGEQEHSFDAIFTPIRHFETSIQSYEYEGKTVEHLFLEIWTDSTITPYEALVQASRKMICLLRYFLQSEL